MKRRNNVTIEFVAKFDTGFSVVRPHWILKINNYTETFLDYKDLKKTYFKAYNHLNK